MGQKWTRVLLFYGKPLDTNRVLCCTEKLCGGTDTAPQGSHPRHRLSTASKQKIYQSEKRKVIGQTTAAAHYLFGCYTNPNFWATSLRCQPRDVVLGVTMLATSASACFPSFFDLGQGLAFPVTQPHTPCDVVAEESVLTKQTRGN